MKYVLTITKTAIQGGVKDPASFDIELFDDMNVAIAQAASLYTKELFNLTNDIFIPYSSFNTCANNSRLVEARIFGEIEVIVIGVKCIGKQN